MDFITMRILYDEGFRTISSLMEADPDDLSEILGIDVDKAYEIVDAAKELLEEPSDNSEKEEVKESEQNNKEKNGKE